MKLLQDRIRKEGKVLPGNIIKVDGFLNHRVDPQLLGEIADVIRTLDGTYTAEYVVMVAENVSRCDEMAEITELYSMFLKEKKILKAALGLI